MPTQFVGIYFFSICIMEYSNRDIENKIIHGKQLDIGKKIETLIMYNKLFREEIQTQYSLRGDFISCHF